MTFHFTCPYDQWDHDTLVLVFTKEFNYLFPDRPTDFFFSFFLIYFFHGGGRNDHR